MRSIKRDGRESAPTETIFLLSLCSSCPLFLSAAAVVINISGHVRQQVARSPPLGAIAPDVRPHGHFVYKYTRGKRAIGGGLTLVLRLCKVWSLKLALKSSPSWTGVLDHALSRVQMITEVCSLPQILKSPLGP